MVESIKTAKKVRICEAALLYAIGYIDSPNASDAHPQWQLYKAQFLGKLTPALLRQTISQNSKGFRESEKKQHSRSYIEYLASIYFGDTFATKEGAQDDGSMRDIRILPYENAEQLFGEYEAYCDITNARQRERAKKSCFRKVLKDLMWKKQGVQIRLLGCKGSFKTCDVCNTAYEMLRDTKKV